ncbi:TetR/AcrR family transcriptional regulator [Lichenibacterium ramalinae]|uniref:TetR/AcrR family transcriptional regulator n=1 Tax=Lichenibacterium ramalinae TaxID=2316527 RepID=UPI0013EC2E2E|nr:TetR/AcrR family transcriptional regulator [Lichenibacterium ramalinae]
MNERRRQAERSSETRALLVHATVSLLQSEGFAGTTTARIARRAGVTTGALHHHFSGKDDLMIAVLDASTARVRSLLERGPTGAGAGFDARHLVDHLWQAYGDEAYWAVWEIIIGTRASEALHERVVEHRRNTVRSVVHPWIEQFVPSDRGRPDAIALFEFMLIAIRGLSLERFLHDDAAYFERHLGLLAEMIDARLSGLVDGCGRAAPLDPGANED